MSGKTFIEKVAIHIHDQEIDLNTSPNTRQKIIRYMKSTPTNTQYQRKKDWRTFEEGY